VYLTSVAAQKRISNDSHSLAVGRRVAPRHYSKAGYDRGTVIAHEFGGKVRVRFDGSPDSPELFSRGELDGLFTLRGKPSFA